MTVRAVVFDFGGVIITPITNKITGLAERHDTDALTMLEILMGPRHESTDHAWHRAERGELAVADIQALKSFVELRQRGVQSVVVCHGSEGSGMAPTPNTRHGANDPGRRGPGSVRTRSVANQAYSTSSWSPRSAR